MGKSRSRRHHRRRGGENSLEQIIHGTESGTDKFTHTVMKEPDKFGDAISGEVMGKETRRGKAGRKVKEFGGQVTNFLKKLKFWGGRFKKVKILGWKTVGQPPGGINAEGKSFASWPPPPPYASLPPPPPPPPHKALPPPPNLHVACGDIANIDPCDFPGGGGNPVTKIPCRATFTTMEDMKKQGLDTSFRKKQSPLTKANYNNIYIFICGLLLIYLVQKLLKKN